MDLGTIIAGVGLLIVFLGAVFGAFWRIRGMIVEVRHEANGKADSAAALAHLASTHLQEHKLHVAEHYVSKQGLREVTDQIMGAIGSLGTQIGSMNDRIDRILEGSKSRTRSS